MRVGCWRACRPTRPTSWEGNTTLAVVMTDADLPKAALAKICHMAFGGFYRTLAPALSLYDGDLVVVLSRGERPAHPHQVGVLAEEAVARAILVAVRAADGFGRRAGVARSAGRARHRVVTAEQKPGDDDVPARRRRQPRREPQRPASTIAKRPGK